MNHCKNCGCFYNPNFCGIECEVEYVEEMEPTQEQLQESIIKDKIAEL